MNKKFMDSLKNPFNYGLIGGVVIVYFSAIGIVEVFSERNLIGESLSLGHLMLFFGALFAGIFTSKKIEHDNPLPNILSGAFAGLVSSIFPLALYYIGTHFNLREIFINVTPNLMDLLLFGRESAATGLFLFVLTTTLLGMIGAGYYLLPDVIKKPFTSGFAWTLGIALFSENVTQILRTLDKLVRDRSPQSTFIRDNIRTIFQDGSLVPNVAFWIFLISFGITLARVLLAAKKMDQPAVVEEELTPKKKLAKQITNMVLLAVVLVFAPVFIGRFLSQVLFLVGLYIMMGLGLNIVVGYAGLLDLGYVAFFAFGAYTMGILTTTTNLNPGGGLNFWMTLPIALMVSVTAGLILGFPVLRMRGDYLAIVTLGFGEIIRILALSDWLAPIMGGAQGVLKIPNPVFFGKVLDTPETLYYIVVAGSLIAGFISVRLRDSRLGRQWMAMREDEDVAEAMGINLVQTKLLAFSIGAGFSGLAGAIFSARLGNIFPHSFNLLISVNILSLIIVGGLGSIPGVVIGSFILVGMPELLREFNEYRLLMYGILLIVMMLNKPEGFIPAEIFKREFHAKDEELAGAQAD